METPAADQTRARLITIVVDDQQRMLLENALKEIGIEEGALRWRKVHSPIGGKDSKAIYRANEWARRAAAAVGVSHGTIELALRVITNAPELEDQIKAGNLTLQQAKRQLIAEGRWATVREARRARGVKE